MAITGVGSYSHVYENTYASSRKEAVKKEEAKETKETKGTAPAQKSAETAKKSSNEEYLKGLQKQVPYVKLQIGYAINTKNDGKVNIVDVNPKLLEKMQSDPKAAKEYTQRLKDVEACAKFFDNFYRSLGYTVVCRHDYLDENGNYSHFGVTVRKDELNEKLRKEAQENAEKQIEKTREKARETAEQLKEKLEEAKESDKEQEKMEADTAKDKAEKLLLEKLETVADGEIYFNNEEMQVIIEAAREEKAGRASTKEQPQAGANFDLQV